MILFNFSNPIKITAVCHEDDFISLYFATDSDLFCCRINENLLIAKATLFLWIFLRRFSSKIEPKPILIMP